MLSKYSWMCSLLLNHDQLTMNYNLREKCLSFSQWITIASISSVKSGVLCPTLISMLEFWLFWDWTFLFFLHSVINIVSLCIQVLYYVQKIWFSWSHPPSLYLTLFYFILHNDLWNFKEDGVVYMFYLGLRNIQILPFNLVSYESLC